MKKTLTFTILCTISQSQLMFNQSDFHTCMKNILIAQGITKPNKQDLDKASEKCIEREAAKYIIENLLKNSK